LKVAKLTNLKLIELAKQMAKEILKRDFKLKNFPKIKRAIENKQKNLLCLLFKEK